MDDGGRLWRKLHQKVINVELTVSGIMQLNQASAYLGFAIFLMPLSLQQSLSVNLIDDGGLMWRKHRQKIASQSLHE